MEDSASHSSNHGILVGYKGSQTNDLGMFYAPYIQLSTHPIMELNTGLTTSIEHAQTVCERLRALGLDQDARTIHDLISWSRITMAAFKANNEETVSDLIAQINAKILSDAKRSI